MRWIELRVNHKVAAPFLRVLLAFLYVFLFHRIEHIFFERFNLVCQPGALGLHSQKI